MKKNLLLAAALFAGLFVNAQEVDENGYTTVELSMGAAYANRVFFDFTDNEIVTQDAYNWDVAFYQYSSMDFGVRINDAHNVLVYEASATPADWDNIDVADEAEWGEPLYNPDLTESIQSGAFDNATLLTGPMDYGWGSYNIGTHHIDGKVIFVLKYQNAAEGEMYKKFMIEDYYGGYTFKYSTWNGTGWSATETKTVANEEVGEGEQPARFFNYFSFGTNAEVAGNEPTIGNWDLVFTRYWTLYNGTVMYRMSGVLQAPGVEVAKVEETQAVATATLPADDVYSGIISSIGHSWKLTPTGAMDNVAYYVKTEDKIYRMYFISNDGSSTGNMFFKVKDVTPTAGVGDNLAASFSIYPNPSNGLVSLTREAAFAGNVSVYGITGAKVFETTVEAGANTTEMDLSGLASGMYLVKIQSGNATATKKLVIK